MKILSASQIRELDQYTIAQQAIPSIDLMERASRVFSDGLQTLFPDNAQVIVFFCGSGNNGGDGLAAARMLHEAAYPVQVFLCEIGPESKDRRINRERLAAKSVISIQNIQAGDDFPALPTASVCVDALFGSGLSRPLDGYWAELVTYLNQLPNGRIAIDIPSGVFADQPTTGISILANHTLSFQLPKLAFLMPENQDRVGDWAVHPIGLEDAWIKNATSPYTVLTPSYLHPLLYQRKRFDHKGTFGHSLIIAGSYGKMGACVLCARAALRAGAGLVSVHIPSCGYEIMQISCPEIMVEVDQDTSIFSQLGKIDMYQSIGIGPGLGQNEQTITALNDLIQKAVQPLVLDADALNILGAHRELLEQLPAHSILTPHPKEFERLFGPSANDFARLELARERAKSLQLIIVLKMGYTAIVMPDGQVFFNTIGNPGMGTAGAGDVLTGIISGLLAQKYKAETACLLGVYLHALAGDLAAANAAPESLIAGDIIDYLGKAFRKLKSYG